MAHDDSLFGFGGGWRQRYGSTADIDQRPGNQWNSREYARVRDPLSEEESGSRFLDASNRLKYQSLQDELRRDLADQSDFLNAQTAVHFWPTVGKFIIPEENTWAAHAQLVHDERNSLYFNPEKYTFFDKVIEQRFPQIHDAKHEGLRKNLAVLRNDVMGIFMDDGSFDPGDEKFVPNIQGIAEALGDALANDKWYKRAFTSSINLDVANVEGVGAAEMYKYLLSRQDNPGVLSGVRSDVKAAVGLPDRAWDLPPLEETPFSPENLAAPPPVFRRRASDNEQAQQQDAAAATVAPATATPPEATTPVTEKDASERMIALSESLGDTARKLRTVEQMEEPPKAESVEEARKILRYLRNLQFSEQNIEDWLDHGTPAEQVAKTEALQQLLYVYTAQLFEAQKQYPEFIKGDAPVDDASNAAGAIALAVAEHTRAQLPADHPQVARLDALIDSLPAESEMRLSQSVERLLVVLETGLERVSGDFASEKSPAEKLLELSNRIQKAALKLRSVDDMEPPAREESIELAREILRKLRNLSFSDKPMEELVATGRPEDKAAFAQKIEEMVDSYQTLLREAAMANPEILQDPRIKDANDAVSGFAAAVTLMATKEIPVSQQAANSITAAESEHAVQKLDGQSMKRLVNRMEGGLESVAKGLEDQQQEQDEEIAQSIIDQHTETNSRRRKRKRRSQRSGFGAKKAQKAILDITADDYVLKQGRFSNDAKASRIDSGLHKTEKNAINEAAFMQGLNAKDIETIRKLGGSLRDIGQQLKNISVTNVNANDKIVPDDKTITQRVIDTELQKQRQGPQGPGM